MIISKSFTFAAAHRLHGHEGLCRFIHGHNYKVELYFEGYELELDSVGRVIDFSSIKENIIKPLKEKYDHNFILSINDPLYIAWVKLAADEGDITKYAFFRHCVQSEVPQTLEDGSNPTAENMAIDFYNFAERTLPMLIGAVNVEIKAVRVWETDTASALYKGV